MAIGFNNPTGVQFNDKFWSKVAVREAKKNIVFSQIGDKSVQPKHYGDTMRKYHNLPILHKLNVNDQGIDANGVSLVSGKWYAYDAAGAMTGDAAGYATSDLAKAAAGATGTIKSGDGNLFGGDTDYAVVKGAFPSLREVGGNVNRVGMTRKEITATVKEFGFYLEYTKKMIDMDTEKNVLRDISREAGRAQAELREAQIQSDLLAASAVNRVFAGDASTMAEIGSDDLPTFEGIRAMELSLKVARTPKQSKMLTGSTKVGTQPISAAYTAYVGYELNPTLQDIKDADGKKQFIKKAEYAAAGQTMQGETGMISETRFIEVEDMQVYKGMGADSTDATDDVEVANRHVGSNGNYDVFPILYVGEDSFGTIGFEGDVMRLQNAKPTPIPGVDPYGKTGTVAASYFYGMMITRPERIRQIACAAKKS